MSADTLRQAAALMRERAESAMPGPWEAHVLGSEGYDVRAERPSTAGRLSRARVARCGYEEWEVDRADAEHIASWHPAVALAVADWLDKFADYSDTGENAADETACALAVATAYLGWPLKGDDRG